MRLFKNVDIKDLDSILAKGILSLNESGNNNWKRGKRSRNSCDKVYLFAPTTKENSFVRYGAALLEVDAEAVENEIDTNDFNYGLYREFICDRVAPEQITAIYIPKIFKNRIATISDETLNRITWCDIEANTWGLDDKVVANQNDFDCLVERGNFEGDDHFNFFRGFTTEQTVVDYYDIVYKF